MSFQNIEQIYAVNDGVRERLLLIAETMHADDAKLLTEKGDWDVAKIFEHLAMVESGMTKIAGSLLAKAKEKGLASDGTFKISQHFMEGAAKVRAEGVKFDAPEMVQPEGGQPIADSLAGLRSSREAIYALRGEFEAVDGTAFTFPHPFFGDLTALDWLVLIGGHETRHIEQIERIISQKDAAKA